MTDLAPLPRYKSGTREWQRQYWSAVLERARNMNEAALIAGVNRTSMYRMLKKCGIKVPGSKARHVGNWKEHGL